MVRWKSALAISPIFFPRPKTRCRFDPLDTTALETTSQTFQGLGALGTTHRRVHGSGRDAVRQSEKHLAGLAGYEFPVFPEDLLGVSPKAVADFVFQLGTRRGRMT